MATDGSGAHALTTGPASDSNPVFSPDGSKIAFTRNGQLMVMPSSAGPPAPIPGTPSCAVSPDFSPDGGRLAYKDCSVSPTRIAVTNLDGSARHFVTSPTGAGGDDEPAFSPDGSLIVYEADGSGADAPFPLFTVDPSGSGTPHPLTTASDYKSSWGRLPAPSVDSAPTIPGGTSPRVGHVLDVTPGAANWGGATSFQWFSCTTTCTPIAGATASTYKPTNADKGRTLKVRQTQSDAAGTASGDSAATAKVAGEPGAKISHTGTVKNGTALIAVSCPKTQSGFCKGKLTLTGSAAAAAKKLGAGSFTIRAGKRGKVKVKLTKRARAALASRHKLKVAATARSRDDAGNLTTTRAKVTLKPAKRK
jgi:dipeptidyl aminopeptidase/acylaminoacyl peptidase